MGHVGIAAIDAARRNHRQRRAACQQRADLHRRGVRAQQPAIGKIKGVVHRPRRMVGGNVQRLEIVEVVFDLRALRHIETGTAEQRLDSQPRPRDRVQPHRAARRVPASVTSMRPGGQLRRSSAMRSSSARRASMRGLHALLGFIDARAGSGALAGRQCAQGL